MKRIDLVKVVADKAKITTPEADKAVEIFLQTIIDTLDKQEEVTIRGFGTFKTKVCKERKAQNITAGVSMTVPACVAPVFKFSPEIKKLLKAIKVK